MGWGKMKYSILGIFSFLFLGTTSVSAWDTSQLDWNGIRSEFALENNDFGGHWMLQRVWRGSLCHGGASFRAELKGHIATVDFQPIDETSMDAVALLENVQVPLMGRYKSELSLCLPIEGQFPVVIDRVDINSRVFYGDGSDNGQEQFKLKVHDTILTGVHLGRGTPPYLEAYLTREINAGMKKVWASTLGDWLSDKLVQLLKKKNQQG